jgi:hypothetical protein
LLIAAIVIPFSLSLNSCDYLNVDRYFYDMTSLDSVFARKDLLIQYINGAANLLPDESLMYTEAWAPYGLACDEAFPSWNDDRHAGVKFMRDEIDKFYTTRFDNWGNYYKGIRKANIILKRINECEDASEIDKRDFAGKAYFLRGYFYFLLLQQYGPPVIVPEEPMESNEAVETMGYERATYDECVSYICKNMENAYQLLPDTRGSMSAFYEPTRGAALAVMSRVLLYDASPWYNGNTFYSDWRRESDGAYFISQEYDNNKWGKAAVAAKRIINMNLYELYTAPKEAETPELPANVSHADFPDGAGNIDPFHSYADMFNGEIPGINNPEFIWSQQEYTSTSGSKSVQWIAFPLVMGGGNGLNITQQLVDAYRMKDGCDMNNSSKEFPFPDADHMADPIGSGYTFSGFEMRGNTAKMYANLEMRFYATIGYNHAFWPGTSYTGTKANAKNLELTYYIDGTGAPNSDLPNDKNWSGYTCKKYIHPEDNYLATIRAKTFPKFRYAEILLNYVEALNELEGSYTDEETGITVSRDINEIEKYFNRIRYRAGLPGLTASELSDKTKIRELIKRERQVEFACEGRRYHDVRRWGDAMKLFNEPFIGMNVAAKTSQRALFHKRTLLTFQYAQHHFTYKMYFYPIAQYIIDRNPKIQQNPGWK